MDDLTKAFNKAKLKVITSKHKGSTFLSTILFSLEIKFDDTLNPPTAATDGISLLMHPDFFMNINEDERAGLLAHEAWHVAFDHINRFVNDYDPDSEDFQTYNNAADYVINNMLDSAGFSLPEGGLINHDWDDLSTDAIYDILKSKSKPEDNEMAGDIRPMGSLGNEGQPLEGSAAVAAKRRLDAMIVKAHIQTEKAEGSEGIGSLPGEISRYIDSLTNPVVPWNTVLENYLYSNSKDDYSMRKFNKKYLPHLCLPSLYTESMGDIAFFCDTSGSVGTKELTQFLSEAHAIKRNMLPESITLVTFDHEIQSINKYGQYEDIVDPELNGGGGTNINPVIEWINENSPEITIIFTDGYFYTPDEKCHKDVIWLIYNNPDFTTEFGSVIHFN